MKQQPNILIVKICAVGDVVMSLTLLKSLRQRYPQAKVTWICGQGVLPLLKLVDGIDKLITVDEKKLLTGSFLDRTGVVVPLWLKLLFRSFCLILIGHGDPRYRLLTWTARGEKRRSFTHNRDRPWPIPGRWHGHEYLRLVTNLEGPESPEGKLPTVSPPLDPVLASRLDQNKTIIVLTPGGAKNVMRDDALRRWPLEHYVDLAGRLLKQDYQIILTGSHEDRWTVQHFNHLNVTNLVGKTDLPDLLALYQHCHMVVTHDSGPLHLAGWAGTTTLALFGPTNPFEKICYKSVEIIWGGEELPCRPCYDGKTYAACSRNECLHSISVTDVARRIERILNKAK